MWRSIRSSLGESILSGLRAAPMRCSQSPACHPFTQGRAPFSSLATGLGNSTKILQRSEHPIAPTTTTIIPCRTFIKQDIRHGKKIADPFVLQRFYRLNWGGWIKRAAGSSKRVWKMRPRVRRRRDNHIFVNQHYSEMFDVMVTRDYRRETFYVDDIYEHYQKRHGMDHFVGMWKPRAEKMQESIRFPQMSSAALNARKNLPS